METTSAGNTTILFTLKNFILTKEEALEKTRKKFTNLLDGDILPGVSVGKIISYYENLIKNEEPDNTMPIGGIERNFLEEDIKDVEFYMRNGFLP